LTAPAIYAEARGIGLSPLPLFVRSDSLPGAFPDARIRSESGSGVP
jgi:hypothetical protein